MARPPRLDFPDTTYHIFCRGHDKTDLFLDDQDRRTFLKHLDNTLEQCPFDLLGYCLMGNHYHLQLKTRDTPLAKVMHRLNTLYAGFFNFKYGKVGHAFQGRYHSIPVETDSYLLTLSRYIHLNPVKACLTAKPEAYLWSSYRAYIGLEQETRVTTRLILDTLDPKQERQKATYRTFVEEGIIRPDEISEETLSKTRIYGSAEFARELTSRARPNGASRLSVGPGPSR